jgi:4-aminobutyrate aminotransferase-like enzyme
MSPTDLALVPGGLGAGDLVYRTPPETRMVRAEGVRLWDSTGRPYLDAEAANGAVSFGYDGTLVAEAARRCTALPGLPSFCESEPRVSVLQRLNHRFEAALGRPGRVSVELGGAQGIEMAMRIVAANRGRGPVLVFEGGYHGRSPFTAHLSASNRYRANQPWPGPSVIRLPYPDCASCPHRIGQACNPACTAAITRLGSNDVFGVPGPEAAEGVSALIIEPLLNVGGCVLPDSAHLRAVVEHARSLGALIVVDEIFTGMHRLGPEWGHQLHGIDPDIVVASKALTNGITALSAIWAREPLASPAVFPPGSHSSTFAGNPFAIATVDAVLDRWDAWPDPAARIADYAEDLATALGRLDGIDLVKRHSVVGALARVELRAPVAIAVRAAATAPADRPGLLLASTGMAPHVVALHPPLTATAAELTEMVELLTATLEELTDEL